MSTKSQEREKAMRELFRIPNWKVFWHLVMGSLWMVLFATKTLHSMLAKEALPPFAVLCVVVAIMHALMFIWDSCTAAIVRIAERAGAVPLESLDPGDEFKVRP